MQKTGQGNHLPGFILTFTGSGKRKFIEAKSIEGK